MQVYEPHPGVTIDTLEEHLARAFASIRDAVQCGETVVVSLDEADVQGTGDVAAAALAHGLLGLARAFAIEGRKPGWHVTILSSPAGTPAHERLRWIEYLAEPGPASGALVRLGGTHLGRVPT